MSNKIRFTNDEIRYIALFENITGAVARDLIIDESEGRVIIVVRSGDVGLAIGKKGARVKMLSEMLNKNIDIIEYSDKPEDFLKNAFSPAKLNEIRITEKLNGQKIAVVTVNPRDKGIAIGKRGRIAERTRLLAKKYFEIDNVIIN